MRPTTTENFDGDATTDRLDPTGKTQVDSGRLKSTRLADLIQYNNYVARLLMLEKQHCLWRDAIRAGLRPNCA